MRPEWLKRFWFRPPPPAIYQLIFTHSKQVSPYLKGSFGELPKACILVGNPNSTAIIQSIYHQLAQANPEAGSGYWLTRTWDLLCWQPIYLSFLSIYGLKSLPDFANFAQFQHRGFIAGYRFASEMHWHGEPEVLVPRAGEQLLRLFEQYRQQINHWTRIRPGFTNHLLADLILSCLIKLQSMRPELDNSYIEQQAKLWLDAFHLSDKHLASLIKEDTESGLKHIRMSCCLAYKCRNGTLCLDCPRLSTNKH
ncbi:siderophore ferric iron reductase [Vibrio vulnificus]|uniref:siderophore ferric iron reductase n=1 Tax=Vibrio vulnificus TaxID=672 RepID=UPI001029416D|nr:siderophore ferric iron reductase [Vibrio vulnificus]EGQ7755852.1 siderophore ferric iron reductase [Vibrio vulnificus]EGQ7994840.1 siderophore ferric iron reductase [Vibrio vulnificus]EGR0129917.1 siderophore ferric iron reductase [Vibrio vulnificus]EGR0753298.1 siderophore ferric iron reductase [Vibrio vulnificus]EHK9115313.1 siderophore ferric iron reductase [Vibrio vulnificus]